MAFSFPIIGNCWLLPVITVVHSGGQLLSSYHCGKLRGVTRVTCYHLSSLQTDSQTCFLSGDTHSYSPRHIPRLPTVCPDHEHEHISHCDHVFYHCLPQSALGSLRLGWEPSTHLGSWGGDHSPAMQVAPEGPGSIML